METENDAGRIEPAEIENKEPTRGRSKKRGKGKKRSTNKEPFVRVIFMSSLLLLLNVVMRTCCPIWNSKHL